MRKKSDLTPEQWEELREKTRRLKDQGRTYSDIRKELKVSASFISRALKGRPEVSDKKKIKKNGTPDSKSMIESWFKGRNKADLEGPAQKLHKAFQHDQKTKVSYTYFTHIRKSIREGTNGRSTPKKPTAKIKAHVQDMQQKTERIAFLEWWVQGERRGWVDQLLKESE